MSMPLIARMEEVIAQFNYDAGRKFTDYEVSDLAALLTAEIMTSKILKYDPGKELDRAEKMITFAQQIQSNDPIVIKSEKERAAKLAGLGVAYRSFYHRNLATAAMFGRYDIQAELEKEYKGSFLSSGIARFLELGAVRFRNGRFKFPYDRTFRKPLLAQVDALYKIGYIPNDGNFADDRGADLALE